MSEPAMFALVRGGEVRYFADRWASALLRREVMWGPADFETWVQLFEPLEEWDADCDGGAVVDFDRRTLTWNSDTSSYRVPRVLAVYQKMLAAAWPGFQIKHVAGGGDAPLRQLQPAGDGNPAIAVHGQRSSRRLRRLLEQGLLRELTAAEIARLRAGSRPGARPKTPSSVT